MWVKECHKPPMTGNGLYIPHKNGDDWGMVYYGVLPTNNFFSMTGWMGESILGLFLV